MSAYYVAGLIALVLVYWAIPSKYDPLVRFREWLEGWRR